MKVIKEDYLLKREEAIAVYFLLQIVYKKNDKYKTIKCSEWLRIEEFRVIKRFYFSRLCYLGLLELLPKETYGIGVYKIDKEKLVKACQNWLRKNPTENPTSWTISEINPHITNV